ncbi:MAG: YcaO-like family protein, partial [Gammaproteobacteria bacterium]|nr:YcaO-like family protein [Gammaproteobacteria bacterium]
MDLLKEENPQRGLIDVGGTLRYRTPEETLDFLKPALRHFGISRVADIGGLDKIGIPVAVAIRPNAAHLCGAQGKGITKDLARISAIMEAIESAHMEFPPPPDLIGTYEKLSAYFTLLDPAVFPKGKLATDLNSLNMGWAACTNLVDEATVHIPDALVRMNSSSRSELSGYFAVTSNGLAAGNTLSEAIANALYELLERDAMWHWLKLPAAKRNETAIDLNTVQDPLHLDLLQKFQSAGVQVEAWSVPSMVHAPVFYCRISEPQSLSAGGFFSGSGCHLLKEIALTRALTEAAQSRVTFISGSRDDVYPRFYSKQRHAQQKLIQEALQNSPFLPGVSFHQEDPDAPPYSQNLIDNIKVLVAALKSKGYMKVLIFNHTKAPFFIPVVQAFVPGL